LSSCLLLEAAKSTFSFDPQIVFMRISIKNSVVFALCLGCVSLGSVFAARCNHISIRGNLIALSDLFSRTDSIATPFGPVEARLVAHAGGAVAGKIYTNSREALDQHYALGFRVFELDFDWTSDGKLVLVHDWERTSLQFCVAPHVFSDAEYTGRKRCDGLTQMTFDDLYQWLHRHADALVVTDTKGSNERLLSEIHDRWPDIAPQLIVQIYRGSELGGARKIKPRAVWFTVYKTSYPAWALKQVKGVDAIVIPIAQYRQYYDPALMARLRCYVHPVASDQAVQTIQSLPGIYGAYVD